MKKIAKLSLVAAVAVAGLTTANAQPLEEAIKNVDVSGSVVYRYNDYNGQDKATTGQTSNDDNSNNNYKVAMNLSSKINEDVKFNSRFIIGGADAGFATLNNSTTADQNVNVTLSNAYFGYTGIKNTTVNVGKQGLTTPWTVAVDSDGNEQTGTGILALSTVGPVTLAGAYFNQTNIGQSGGILKDGSTFIFNDVNGNGVWDPATEPTTGAGNDGKISTRAVATVGAIATFAPVTLDAWYLDMEKTFDTYTLGAKVADTISGIALGADARWVSLNLDDNSTKNDMIKIVLTADAGLVDGKVAYAKTNKEGGLTALDIDATTTLLGWNLTSNNKKDADYWQAVLGFDILSNLNLSANYGNVQYAIANGTDDMEDEEIYGQLLYKMSKNLNTYVRYGTLTKENKTANTTQTDGTVGRLQVEYTF